MSIGKNSAFLNSFWDLASDEREKRVAAAGQIIEHVKGPQGGSVDTEYALKRLVRNYEISSILILVACQNHNGLFSVVE